jgi:hypothetical protein
MTQLVLTVLIAAGCVFLLPPAGALRLGRDRDHPGRFRPNRS